MNHNQSNSSNIYDIDPPPTTHTPSVAYSSQLTEMLKSTKHRRMQSSLQSNQSNTETQSLLSGENEREINNNQNGYSSNQSNQSSIQNRSDKNNKINDNNLNELPITIITHNGNTNTNDNNNKCHEHDSDIMESDDSDDSEGRPLISSQITKKSKNNSNQLNYNNLTENTQNQLTDCITFLQIGKDKLQVFVDLNWTTEYLKSKFFSDEIEKGKNVRFVHKGKLLKDTNILKNENVKHNDFLHVSISTGHGIQSRDTFENPPVQDGDGMIPDEEVARRLQTQEFVNRRRLGGLGGVPINSRTGDTHDFGCGFFIGFIFGIWALFMLVIIRRHRSLKFRLGVLSGMMFSLAMESFQQESGTTDQENDSVNSGINNNSSTDSILNETGLSSTIPMTSIVGDNNNINSL